jgi:acid phosphatase (class A)
MSALGHLHSRIAITVLACLLTAAADAPAPSESNARAGTSIYAADRWPGYLDAGERPDSVSLAPPPPAEGTARLAADVEGYKSTRALRDTARWRLARSDSDLKFPHAAGTFSCALGVPIEPTTLPNLYELLQRTIVDAGQSTYPAKDKYRRPRPYAVYGDAICVPEDAERLRTSGAYPSGHASLGWVWALMLAELAPERADALLARGLAFGESRVICGVHWPSDIDAGRTIAAAVFAKLHSKPEFVAQMRAAKAEIAKARASSAPARVAECATERNALAESASTVAGLRAQ